MMMNFKKVAGAGIAAVTFSLMAGTAMAAPITNAGAISYATQGIPASGAIQIPSTGLPTVVVTTPAAFTAVAPNTFQLTYSLPAGVTFVTNPTTPTLAFSTTGAGNIVLSSGGAGFSTITYLVTITTATTAGSTITFNFPAPTSGTAAFSLTGATALSTPKSAGQFLIGDQVTNSGQTASLANDAAPTTTTLATSVSALTVAATAPGGGALNIDVLSPSNGTKFYNGAGADATVGDDGAFAFTVTTSAAPATGVGTFAFTGTTVAETFAGNTGGLSAAYLSTNNTCNATATGQAAVTGTVAGTVTATGITFGAVPVATYTGVARELCLYTAGTALLSANPFGFAVTAAIDTTTTALSGFNAFAYNGTVANYPYAVNSSSSYASYIRVANKTASPIVVSALVTAENGATATTQIEAGLAAGNNDLVSFSTITTNAGVASPSGRYNVTVFGPAGTLFENLLVNPGGVVTQLQ